MNFTQVLEVIIVHEVTTTYPGYSHSGVWGCLVTQTLPLSHGDREVASKKTAGPVSHKVHEFIYK